MARYFLFQQIFKWTLPLFFISLFWFPLSYVYLAIFFLCGLYILFEITIVPEYVDSEAATHFERNSRWNSLNYGVAAYLILSSMTTILASVLLARALSSVVLISWAAGVYLIQRVLPSYLPRMYTDLIIDYISDQAPEIDARFIQLTITELLENPTNNPVDLAEEWKADPEIIRRIVNLYQIYVKRNKQLFAFPKQFGNPFKEEN